MNFWAIFRVLLQFVFPIEEAISAKGGHGSFQIEVIIKDAATGTPIVDLPAATITL